MVLLSVLVVSLALQTHCRRLSEDIDNDITAGSAASSNPVFRVRDEWIKISVAPKPVITKAFGSYLELECEAMGSPPPTLRWYQGTRALSEHQSFESNLIPEVPSQGLGKIRGRLVINYLLPVHSGTFTCVAESGSKVITADSTIYVVKKEDSESNFTDNKNKVIAAAYHKPRISLWAPTYMDVIGTNVVLPCRTFGNPKPKQIWLDSQGQEIGENEDRVTMLPDGSLSITSLSWADMGVYTCVVSNLKGGDSVETFVYPMKESK